MSNPALSALTDQIGADRRASAEEALQLRRQIFPDDVVSRVKRMRWSHSMPHVHDNDTAWDEAYTEALVVYAMQDPEFPGYVHGERADWLAGLPPGRLDLNVLLKVLDRCENTPDALRQNARDRVAAMPAGKPVTADVVELMRRCLYSGDGFVNDDEARWLFAVDAESDGRANDPAGIDLFVKAQLCHLMGRQLDLPTTEEDMAREKWLRHTSIHPLSNLMKIFSSSAAGYKEHVRELGDRDRLEDYYEAANANAEEDAELAADENDWTVRASNADGKLTANEHALLAELDKIKPAAA